MAAPQLNSNDIAELKTEFSGALILPRAPEYDAVRQVHNGMIDRRPALIARCISTADVVDAIKFGVTSGLEIAVRGGGHNVAGRAVCEGGLMIDLSLMKGIWVNPSTRRARAQGGVTWGEFNRATQLHNLATTGGAVGSTGIAGLTLGGGFGYLMGRHGYTIDNLVSVEIVTADGRVLTASEDENSDLFWGLRGGGGNFGVVTHFEYVLHRVGPEIAGGLIAFKQENTMDVLNFAETLPDRSEDDFTTVCSLTHSPDGSGQKLAAMLVSHVGGIEAATKALGDVRAIAEPEIDQLGQISYCRLNQLLDPGFPKSALNYWKSVFVASLDDKVKRILADQFAICPSPMSKLIVECPHGAALRRDPDDTAFPHRSVGFSILILGQWQQPSETEKNIFWVRETYDRLKVYANSGAYGNYLAEDELSQRVGEAFGKNLPKLQALKQKYDPGNVFHLNQNITPAKET